MQQHHVPIYADVGFEDWFGVKHPLCHMFGDKPIPICICGELLTINDFVNQFLATVMRVSHVDV